MAFTAGNPRVEHITGVVHLYRDVPADSAAQPSGSDAAPAAQACYPSILRLYSLNTDAVTSLANKRWFDRAWSLLNEQHLTQS